MKKINYPYKLEGCLTLKQHAITMLITLLVFSPVILIGIQRSNTTYTATDWDGNIHTELENCYSSTKGNGLICTDGETTMSVKSFTKVQER